MSANPSSLENFSISAHVYAALKKEIIEGGLPPGARLIVTEIADRFRISQAPVREALERLKQEGLINGRANKGSVVSDITSKDIDDIYALRERLEGFAVRQSIAQLNESDFRHLDGLIASMNEALQGGDMLKTVEIDMRFHGFFYERCGNHAILDVWNQMSTKVMWFMAISNKHGPTDKLIEGHEALMAALRTKDADHAEQIFLEHIKNAYIRFL
ncbi:GntR family transcriptional regulator [Paenibacillus ginsengihumi]|uniref:GntR family transcriptional regulator n=1 Tax=Paenibacillus ginsengihumi TaxID=431596 RepID=UPI000372E300|nr:GntR family transcriptional regulator [Paenibacillus ginsengihumi]